MSRSSSQESTPVSRRSPQSASIHAAGDEAIALKRKLEDTQAELREVTQQVSKRPFTTKTLGRGIRRLVSCYEPLLSMTAEADRRVIAEAQGTTDPFPTTDEEVELFRARDRTFTAYRLLIEFTPEISDLMKKPNSATLKAYLNQLQEGANAGRVDDNSRLKWEVANWINGAYHLEHAMRLNIKNRDNRGLQHDICGELLTPIEVDWNNLAVRDAIRNGRSGFKIRDNYFLRCLYPDGKGDPNRVEKGFLRSHWLLLAFHAIFISPSVEEDEYREDQPDGPPQKKRRTSEKCPKSSVSTILNMKGKVTGRAIAYTAVLLVFNLHDVSSWRESHNGFSFDGFYNFLLDYFEGTPSTSSKAKARVRSLLDWWNWKMFPHQITSSSDSRASYKKLAAQRAAEEESDE